MELADKAEALKEKTAISENEPCDLERNQLNLWSELILFCSIFQEKQGKKKNFLITKKTISLGLEN